jgi:hypothetical protein
MEKMLAGIACEACGQATGAETNEDVSPQRHFRTLVATVCHVVGRCGTLDAEALVFEAEEDLLS